AVCTPMRSSGSEIGPPSRLTKPILMGSPVAGPATVGAGASVAGTVAAGAAVTAGAGWVSAGAATVVTAAGGGAVVVPPALLSLPQAVTRKTAQAPSPTATWLFIDDPPLLARTSGGDPHGTTTGA